MCRSSSLPVDEKSASGGPLPGRSAALSGQHVITSFYSSLRVAIIVCPLRAADLPESGQLVIESFYSSLRGATYNIECRLSAEGSGPPGKRTSRTAEPWRPLRLCERKSSQLAQVASLSSLAKPQGAQNLLHFYFVIEFRINSLRGSRYSASRFQYSLLVNCQSPPPRFLLTLLGKLFMELI